MPARLNIVRDNMFNRAGNAPRVLHGNSPQVAPQLEKILNSAGQPGRTARKGHPTAICAYAGLKPRVDSAELE